MISAALGQKGDQLVVQQRLVDHRLAAPVDIAARLGNAPGELQQLLGSAVDDQVAEVEQLGAVPILVQGDLLEDLVPGAATETFELHALVAEGAAEAAPTAEQHGQVLFPIEVQRVSLEVGVPQGVQVRVLGLVQEVAVKTIVDGDRSGDVDQRLASHDAHHQLMSHLLSLPEHHCVHQAHQTQGGAEEPGREVAGAHAEAALVPTEDGTQPGDPLLEELGKVHGEDDAGHVDGEAGHFGLEHRDALHHFFEPLIELGQDALVEGAGQLPDAVALLLPQVFVVRAEVVVEFHVDVSQLDLIPLILQVSANIGGSAGRRVHAPAGGDDEDHIHRLRRVRLNQRGWRRIQRR